MKIGIIGAGIAGLTAGRILANAGHEVTVYEQGNTLGGRLASKDFKEGITSDYGVSCITARTPEFSDFITELKEKGILEDWTQSISYHSGEKVLDEHPSLEKESHYSAKQGLSSIANYLSRWVDVELNSKISGITFIGDNPQTRKQWMLNFQSAKTMELDAIIVATPGVQALGVIQTSQDETAVRRVMRTIDDIHYSSSYAVVLGYNGVEKPDWKLINANNEVITEIINESAKRQTGDTLNIVAHTTAEFASEHVKSSSDEVLKEVLKNVVDIAGKWASKPSWAHVHFWKHDKPVNTLSEPFMELDGHPAALALIGDYFQGSDTEAAYLSGYRLAHHWLQKFQKNK